MSAMVPTGRSPRKNAIHAAGDDAVSRNLHVVFVGDVLHYEQRLASAANRTLDARLHQHGAHAAVFVRQQQNLRGIFVGLDDFADHAIGRDDAHVVADAVTLAAIEINGLAAGVRASTDHARADHGHVHIRLAEFQAARQGDPPHPLCFGAA